MEVFFKRCAGDRGMFTLYTKDAKGYLSIYAVVHEDLLWDIREAFGDAWKSDGELRCLLVPKAE